MDDREYYIEKIAEEMKRNQEAKNKEVFRMFPKAEVLSNGNYLVAGIECYWSRGCAGMSLFITNDEVNRINRLNYGVPREEISHCDKEFRNEAMVGKFIIKYLQ